MGLIDYLSKRTQEQVKSDKEAEQREIDKKRIEEELKYQESLDKQPSRFEEDLHKITKKLVNTTKHGVSVAVPVIKKTVGKAKPVLKTVIEKGVPVVERMGKGAAQTEYYDEEQKRKNAPREPQQPPQRVRSFVDNTSSGVRVGKGYDSNKLMAEKPRKQKDNTDFFVSGRPPRVPHEEPVAPMKKTVGKFGKAQKKTQKNPPKKESKRGFGLGF